MKERCQIKDLRYKIFNIKKMLSYVLFMFCLVGLFFNNVLAQTEPPKVEWEKTFGGESYDEAFSIQQTSDGGYIVAGNTSSFGAGDVDFYVIKLDKSGNKIWEKTFGGENGDSASSIQQTSDGGYIVAGYTSSFGAGGVDVYVLKLNSSGNKIWEKTFGGSGSDAANSIHPTTDGGYIVAGYTLSFGAGNDDFHVVKLTADGNKIWSKTFGGKGFVWANSIQQTSDGGYIVAGYYTESFVAGDYDFYVVKLSGEGPPKPKLPANLITSIKFIDEDGNNFLDAEETGKIIVNIANKGEGDAYQVSVVLKPEISNLQLPITNLKYEEKISVGEIAPNTEKKIEIPISANENISSGKISFKIKTFEANGFDAEPVLLTFETQKLKEPNLKIASVGIEEVSTVIKNVKIDLGESIDVKAIIQNSGEGTAKEVKAEIICSDTNIFITSKKNFNLANISAIIKK